MPRITQRKPLAAALVLTLLGAWNSGGAALDRAEPGEGQKKPVKELTRVFYGNTKACGGCHGSDKPAEDGKETVQRRSTLLSRGNELHIWDTQDKHRIAAKVLTEGRGKRMAEVMGIKGDIANPKTNAQWKQCLTCHGVYIADEKEVDPETFGPEERMASGVSCVVCHGAYEEWVVEHSKTVKNIWRKLTREEKEQYGLNDLWDPGKRAALCCSCHVGNAKEGKVVTHEMYAAGHPPLPSFEIVSFSEVMPRHWETMPEKYARLSKYAKQYDAIYHFDEKPHELQQVRLLMTSAVVAFRDSVELIAAHAEAAQKGANAQAADRAWPEFALYDCYACHHDLKTDSWRQKRGYVGVPGRPQMRDWPTVLVPLALRHEQLAGKQTQDWQTTFDKDLKGLEGAFSKAPFGDPKEVRARAEALMKWSDGLLAALKETKLDAARSRELVGVLLNRPEKSLLDFDSARQVGWGLRSLLGETDPAALKAPAVKAPLDALVTELRLELPKGQQPIVGELPESLAKLASFDPEVFRKNLKALAQALQQK